MIIAYQQFILINVFMLVKYNELHFITFLITHRKSAFT